jgi:DNA-binding transcriptional ArsR family regulator
MDYEIGNGLVIKKGKVEFIDNRRIMPLNLYHAIKKSSFSGVEVQLILEIYDLSYGFYQRSTKFLSISEIARALDASRNSVKNALRKLEERLVVYPVGRKTIQGNELCSYEVNLRFEYWEGNKPSFYRWVEEKRKRWSARQVKVAKGKKERKKKQNS